VAEGDVLGEAVQQLLLSMQQLARLSMSRMHLAQGSIWQLPSRLTYLSFYAVEPPVTALGQSCLAQSCLAFSITTLPQLQVLDLARSSFYPTVLESMPQLQSLSLDSLYLLPRAADAEGQPGDATFLSAVGTLHHLKHLRLFNTLEKDADLQQYSGLAACSQLTALLIAVPNAMPLPCGAVQHIFQSGRPLLQLQSLELPGCIVETGGGFNAAELRNIMRACPGLRHLDIVGATGAGASQALLELPASCSSLMVGSLTPDDASAQVVATLTQLKQLFWHDAQDLTDTGFEQLTALTALTRLFVYDVLSLSAVVAGEDLGKLKVLSLTTSTKVCCNQCVRCFPCCTVVLSGTLSLLPLSSVAHDLFKRSLCVCFALGRVSILLLLCAMVLPPPVHLQPPEEPDVWKQVRGRCSQARAWRQRMSVELQETQNLQQQVRDLQQQNCELQQQNVWLQQQNVWLEQQNSELQQQLAQLIS
jgi:hypothetical protein